MIELRRTLLVGSLALMSGCVAKPPTSERETLSHVTQLTSGFSRAGEAYFSADAKWVIFQGIPQGEANYQMFVAPLDGRRAALGTPVRISPPNSKNTCGYFSPDGSVLLFASTAHRDDPKEVAPGYQRGSATYRWAFSPNMEIYRVDGWRQAMATASAAAAPSTQPAMFDFAKHALTHNDAYDAEGSFSPDGKHIIFCSNRDGDLELYAMRADGTNPVRLTHAKGYDGGPFFSPDGKRIVYRSDRAGNDLLQVFTADLAFDANGDISGIANERQLTHDANVNWGPYWHPSGKYLLYASSAQGHDNYELYLIRADGTKNCRITFSPGFDGLPVFSGDGKQMMWSSKRAPDGTTQIFIADFKLPDYVTDR